MKIINDYSPAVPSFGVEAAPLYILTEDDRGLKVVYFGIIPDSAALRPGRSGYSQRVALRGTKLRYEEAVTKFPGLRREEYRS